METKSRQPIVLGRTNIAAAVLQNFREEFGVITKIAGFKQTVAASLMQAIRAEARELAPVTVNFELCTWEPEIGFTGRVFISVHNFGRFYKFAASNPADVVYIAD